MGHRGTLNHRLRRAAKKVGNPALGLLATAALRLIRRFDPEASARFGGRCMRLLGPLLPENTVGRANLIAAFPEKTREDIDRILADVWENLGKVGGEFAHLDRLWDFDLAHPNSGRITTSDRTMQLFDRLRHDGKGALIFAAHLGNWELPALAGPAYELKSAVLFRRPNIAAVDKAVQDIRAVNMGELIATTLDAPLRITHAVQNGVHVGMLVDQHYSKGVDVNFFGRPAKTNPMLARIARQIECPIHGVRIIRLPDSRFRAELTEEVQPARDTAGAIDIQATMQKITTIIEGWVREHPEQWLWLHRRWR